MDQKQKLIELILSAPKINFPIGGRMQGKTYQTASNLAEHLLANGVVAIDLGVVSAKNRPLISQCFGHPLDEIIDLIRAKEEGRISVLPIKMGQTVYRTSGNYSGEKIHEGFVDQIVIHYGCRKTFFYTSGHPLHFIDDNLGRNVFLTREEAENALAERESQ